MPTRASEAALAKVLTTFGFVPNLMRETLENPAVVEACLAAQRSLAEGILTLCEQQVVMLAVSSSNGCRYCSAVHRTIARDMGVDRSHLVAIDNGELPTESRLRALTRATWTLLEKHGWLSTEELSHVNTVGINRAQLYEVIALIGIKTISNFINHIAGTEVDAVFAGETNHEPDRGSQRAFDSEKRCLLEP